MSDPQAGQDPAVNDAPDEDEDFAAAEAEAPGRDPAERIAELESELAGARDQMMRALADAENTRRRAERDRGDALKYGAANIAKDLLGVADNLARALESAPKVKEDAAVAGLVDGVAMTAKQLNDALEKAGVKRIAPLGEKLDPNFHQAMMEVESADYAPGLVAQVMQDGYVLHDRLLRPAMVTVSKGPPSVDKTV